MSYAVGQRVSLEGVVNPTPGIGVEVVGTLQNRSDWYNVRESVGGTVFAVHESSMVREA